MMYLEILMGAFLLVLILLAMMLVKNRKLKTEVRVLKEVLELKDATISNFEASRVAVKDVIENLSAHDEVMALVEAGESRAEISEKMGIPVNKIELIIKFDKIKKEKHL
jgi:DNA-directed RNA polymerase specialized sigma24 family protein